MALSSSVLVALKLLEPDSLNSPLFSFFEFLKYETDDLRNEKILLKDDLINRYNDSGRRDRNVTAKTLRSEFYNFSKILSVLGFADDGDDVIEDLKWEKITEVCNILRKIESSDEKKVRWALLHLLSKGKKEIAMTQIKSVLGGFQIPSIERTVQKIIKTENESGLDATFDGQILVLNTEETLAEHYIADAIEEKSRRSPGEIEKDILELLDEGSYSNQEISRILELDEAIVSRVMTKLRNQNKLVLSSFGNKGFRYYTTNCQNCPFGKTSSSCRKDVISYIVNAFKEAYDIELTSQHFEGVEYNQSLLAIKRIITMSKKDTMTKLESNTYENLEKFFRLAVKNSIQKSSTENNPVLISSSEFSKLPKIFQMGLKLGMEYEINLIKSLINETKKENPQSLDVFSKVVKGSNQFLKSITN